MIKLTSTKRGLLQGEFEDRNGRKCSIQESSLQTEQCLWLGVDVDENGQPLTNVRMHLTRKMAHDLFNFLRHFSRVGSLGYDDPKEMFQVGTWVVGIGDTNRGVEARIIEILAGDHVTVQDNLRSGIEGQYVCLWDRVDLMWEPCESPENITSRYDRILADDDPV